jgi:5'-AMP-activated protein kinase regulatory gamma subunit
MIIPVVIPVTDICTISKDTPLIEAMHLLLSKRVSALPLIDDEGRVVDIYAKFDAVKAI